MSRLVALSCRSSFAVLFVAGAVIGQPAASQVTQEAWSPGGSSIGEPEVIPPAYRGVWAPSAALCADQDGVERMEVLPNGVNFYDSGARLERVTQAGQERSIRLKLAYEGEGGFWDRVDTWTIDETGNRLTMEDTPEGGGAPRSFVFVRCH